MFETVADLREFAFPRFTEEGALLPEFVAEALSVVLVVADLELFILRPFVVALARVLALVLE